MNRSFKHISVLNVLLNFGSEDVPVGRLATKNGRIYFEYDPDFLNSRLEISPAKLALQQGLVENDDTTFNGLFGVFNDSLPDGWGKLLLDRALLSKGIAHEGLTPLDRLSIVGTNGMGALKYEPQQSVTGQEYSLIDLDRITDDIADVTSGSISEVVSQLQTLAGSSAGARPKILVGFNPENNHLISMKDELPTGYYPWLIKFPSSSDPSDIAEIEQAYAQMAKHCGIEMTETKLFQSESGHSFFGTERFDRSGKERFHMLTACGLLHSSHRFPSLDYKDLINATWHLTKDHREMEKVFRLCCFNVLAHNRDDHSKNFSFLMNSHGKWTFAPSYDLTFSFGPGSHQSTMVLGEGEFPKRSHLQKLANELGLKKGEQIIQEVNSGLKLWPDFSKKTGVSKQSWSMIASYHQIF